MEKTYTTYDLCIAIRANGDLLKLF